MQYYPHGVEALTTPAARRMLSYISPVYSRATRFLSLIDALGAQLDEACVWAHELSEQALPQTASWALPLWEAEYALRGEGSDEARRAVLLSKLRAFASVNPWAIEQCAAAATGFDAQVVENTGPNEFTIRVAHYTADEARLRAMVDEIKPAHLIYKVKYAQGARGGMGVACGVRLARRYALGMLDG